MKLPSNPFVLSIEPFSHGLAYAVFEGNSNLFDWGMKTAVGKNASAKNAQALRGAKLLMERYSPSVLVLPDTAGREERIRKLATLIADEAGRRGIAVKIVSREEVRAHFAKDGASTREQIAAVIAARYEVLAAYLPPPRKTWEAEKDRLRVFDAVGGAEARSSA